AKWALALRMREATNAAVEAAFNRGEIVRTHLLRPTWHFVAPDDIRWLLQLTAPRVNLRCGSTYRRYELDPPVFKRSTRAITNALKGGTHLTRSELKAVLSRAGVVADDTVRLGHILLRAELDGVVCSGPRRGNQFTYALLEERVTAGKVLTRDEALAELTRRYFTSHGPATLADFIWWSGLTTDDARGGVALLDREIEQTQLERTIYWTPNSAPNPKHSRGSNVPHANAHLLPAYDEYNVAYKNRQVVFEDGASRMTSAAALGPVVAINGKIVGTWKATFGAHSVKIAVDPAITINRQQKAAIGAAAERYAAFLGLPLESWNRGSLG
ncbi:MAG TPA: winged helix DNA-binding domain-containing protein, partial [Pyrinomonadaceae bacterium]|nr:winged helix DNA-binding domain-containing protein [Pyrinomonadaceae bacterium]